MTIFKGYLIQCMYCTFLARMRMLLVWNGTWSVAIWYRMQPAAQISAFSV